ncbi:C1 family peptidase [Mucilaginibacter glaciei]|uniref:C1 family peptidase n=1 Tax=Mucilaginibacter glaciei TaxID=2772109 RepID=A0A926S256_9SPHI|nr:C1 family peptidase [Mucilaginibacter glaciei]MBD1393507.1 C1 family peptidase [Mucilaginibacter glaciei]
MNRSNVYYGWKPDLPDFRDFRYAAPAPVLEALPAKADLREKCPPVYNQAQLGSCTANAIAGAFEFDLMKQAAPVFTPSRLFIYYNTRVIENTVNTDAGAYLRDGMSSISNIGVCNEQIWPYNISEFATKPFESCYKKAAGHKALSFYRVDRSLDQMKGCLADGYPFVFGFSVYEQFESQEAAATGTVNLPLQTDKFKGGHAVVAVGYNDAAERFLVRNSWGEGWGMHGYFTLPYAYLLNEHLSDDFWTLRLVSEAPALQPA